MTKRKKPTKKRGKKSPKKPKIKVVIPRARGAYKAFYFSHKPKSPRQVVSFLQANDFSTFNYLIRKNKPDGVHFKPPLFVVCIVGILNKPKVARKTKKRVRYISQKSPDIAITRVNIKSFVIDYVKSLQNKWDTFKDSLSEDYDEDDEIFDNLTGEEDTDDPRNLDVSRIVEVGVKFYYGVNAPDDGRLSDEIEPDGILLT